MAKKIAKKKKGIRSFDSTKIYNAVHDIKESACWEDLHDIYRHGKRLLQTFANVVAGKTADAKHLDMLSKLNSPEYAVALRTVAGYLVRDIRNWDNILESTFDPIRNQAGPVGDNRGEEYITIGDQLTNIFNGIENSLQPLQAEISTFAMVGEQNIYGYNAAELEVLPVNVRRQRALESFTIAIDSYNSRSNFQDRIVKGDAVNYITSHWNDNQKQLEGQAA